MNQTYRLRRLSRDEHPILRIELTGNPKKPSDGIKLLAYPDIAYKSIVTNGKESPIPKGFAMIEIILVPEKKANSVELTKFMNHALDNYIEDMFTEEFEFLSRTKMDLLMWVLRLSPYDDTCELSTPEEVLEEDMLSHIPCMVSVDQYNMDVGIETFMPVGIMGVLEKTSILYEHEPQGSEITSIMYHKNWKDSIQEVLKTFIDNEVPEDVSKSLSKDVSLVSNLTKNLEFFMTKRSIVSTPNTKKVLAELLGKGVTHGQTADHVYDVLKKSLILNMPRMVEGFRQLQFHVENIVNFISKINNRPTIKAIRVHQKKAIDLLRKWETFRMEYQENEFERFASFDKEKVYSEVATTRDQQLSWLRENIMTVMGFINKDWINKVIGVDIKSPEYIAGSKEHGSRSLSEYLETCSLYWGEGGVTEDGKIIRQIFFDMDMPCSLLVEAGSKMSVRGLIDGYYTSDIASSDSFKNFLLFPRARENGFSRTRSYQRRSGVNPLEKSMKRSARSRGRGTKLDEGVLNDLEKGVSSFPTVIEEGEEEEDEDNDSANDNNQGEPLSPTSDPQNDLYDMFGEKDDENDSDKPSIMNGGTFLKDKDGTVLARTRNMTMRTNGGHTMRDTMGRTLVFSNINKSSMIDIVSKLDEIDSDTVDDTKISSVAFFDGLLAVSRLYRFKKSRSLDFSRHITDLLCISRDSFDNFIQVSIALDKIIVRGSIIKRADLEEYAEVDFYNYDYSTVLDGSIPTFIYLTCMNVHPVLSSILSLYGNMMDRDALTYLSASIKKLHDILEYFKTMGVDLWMKPRNIRHVTDMDYLEEVNIKEDGSYTPPYPGLLGVPKGSSLPGSSKSDISSMKHDMHELITGRTIKDSEEYLEHNENILHDLLRRHVSEEDVPSSVRYIMDVCDKLREDSLGLSPFHEGFSRPVEPTTFEEIIIRTALCDENVMFVNNRYRRDSEKTKAMMKQRAANMTDARKLVDDDNAKREKIRNRDNGRNQQPYRPGSSKMDNNKSVMESFAENLRSKLRQAREDKPAPEPVDESLSFREKLRKNLDSLMNRKSSDTEEPVITKEPIAVEPVVTKEPIAVEPVVIEEPVTVEQSTPASLFIEASTDIQNTRKKMTNVMRFHDMFSPFH